MQNQPKRGVGRGSNRGLVPMVPTGDIVAEFTNYLEAAALVDRMVAGGFAANLIAIVGSDLKSVERIRARITNGRVALSGALNGAWLGLFAGLIFASATSASAFTNSVAATSLVGAGLGMIWNIIRFTMRGANRTFLSATAIIAASYQVVVPVGLGAKAQELADKPKG